MLYIDKQPVQLEAIASTVLCLLNEVYDIPWRLYSSLAVTKGMKRQATEGQGICTAKHNICLQRFQRCNVQRRVISDLNALLVADNAVPPAVQTTSDEQQAAKISGQCTQCKGMRAALG